VPPGASDFELPAIEDHYGHPNRVSSV